MLSLERFGDPAFWVRRENPVGKIVSTSIALILVALGLSVGYVVYTNRPLPRTVHDEAIVERTLEILSDESAWSRGDTRECADGAEELSLYCALRRASIDVTGSLEHRAAALQEVRYAIDQARPGADHSHRLMDFNNGPQVTLVDVHAMLEEALATLRASD